MTFSATASYDHVECIRGRTPENPGPRAGWFCVTRPCGLRAEAGDREEFERKVAGWVQAWASAGRFVNRGDLVIREVPDA